MEGLWLSLLLKPFLAVAFLAAPVLIAYLIWRKMPDGKLKRVLFRHYGKPDNMPWTKAQGLSGTETPGPESLPRYRSLEAAQQSGSDRSDSTPRG